METIAESIAGGASEEWQNFFGSSINGNTFEGCLVDSDWGRGKTSSEVQLMETISALRSFKNLSAWQNFFGSSINGNHSISLGIGCLIGVAKLLRKFN